MNKQQTEQLASSIVRRANALDISIAKLCRLAGVSRRWFERFKKRVPTSVEVYMKLTKTLSALEEQRQSQPNT